MLLITATGDPGVSIAITRCDTKAKVERVGAKVRELVSRSKFCGIPICRAVITVEQVAQSGQRLLSRFLTRINCKPTCYNNNCSSLSGGGLVMYAGYL